jgi:hypothetical protein
MPAHHLAETYLDAYLEVGGLMDRRRRCFRASIAPASSPDGRSTDAGSWR